MRPPASDSTDPSSRRNRRRGSALTRIAWLGVLLLSGCDGDEAPSPISAAVAFVAEDGSVASTLTGVDDRDAETDLTVDVTASPEHGDLDVTSGSAPLTVTYTPEADYHGVDSLQFTLTDSDGHRSGAATLVLVVEPVNDAPLAADDPGGASLLTTDTVTPLTIDVLANDTDPEDDPLRVVSTSVPSSGSVTIGLDGRLTYVPAHPQTGTVAFDYTVVDGHGGQDSATVTLDVTLGQPVEIGTFVASPDIFAWGQSAELSWTTLAATECRIDPDVGPVALPDGTAIVTPVATTHYALTCLGPHGPAVAGVTVSPSYDSDGDGILDLIEGLLGYDPFDPDMDGDGLPDGLEDANADGLVDAGETDALDADSDDDGRPDGAEDLDADGLVDEGETDPLDPDSDDDDLCDGPRTDNEGDGIAPADDCTDAEVLLVRADPPMGTPDGLRWETAFDTLEEAMSVAQPGQQVWVATGTYQGDGSEAVLTMVSGVDLYGGFEGDEFLLVERPDPMGLTILDGEMERQVVVGASGAVLDGFVITGGQGDNGGGMYNKDASPMLANVTFCGNSADYGGGMYNDGSSPVLTNVAFSGNSVVANGGGMYNKNSSSPVLTNVTFSRNSAQFSGGMYNYSSSSPVLTNVTFHGNSATNSGGGMHTYSNSSVVLTNVTFHGNSAANGGGGMYIWFSSPVLTNVTFSANSATNNGGGMVVVSSSPALTNVAFWSTNGGDVYESESPGATYSHTCSALDLDGIVITENPFEIGNASGQVFLDPTAGASCIDAGDNAAADTAFAPGSWKDLTTRSDGLTETEVDGAGSEIVDLGRHYHPEAVVIETFEASDDDTSLVWTTDFAGRCLLAIEDGLDLIPLDNDEIDAGSLAVGGLTPGETVSLICFGAVGEPAVAHTTVPSP